MWQFSHCVMLTNSLQGLLRNVALRTYSLTFGFREGIAQLVLSSLLSYEKSGNNLAVQTHCTAVMSSLDSTVYLSPYTVDLPEQWKPRPPKCRRGQKALCVCVFYVCANASSNCPYQTAKALISAREACTQFQTKERPMDEGGEMGGRPTEDEWICFVIQIPNPDSARNCSSCVKCVIQTVAGGADDEIATVTF